MNIDDRQQEQTPYVEDTALTWKTMSRAGRVAVSAGILAVGAFTIAGPAMPVMAQILGFVDPNHKLLDSADAQTVPTLGQSIPGANGGGIAPAPGAPIGAGPDAGAIGGAGQAAGALGGAVQSNIQAVPPVSVKPKTNGGSSGSTVQLPATTPNFGNTTSATPSAGAGTNGSTGSGKGGRGGYGGEHERGDRQGGENEGSDD